MSKADAREPLADAPRSPADAPTPSPDPAAPITPLAGPTGHPAHPAVVALPIGAWVASAVFDVASHVVAEPAFLAYASRWLIGLGVLGALAAAMFGLMDLLTITPGTRPFRVALWHLSLALVATAGYAAGFALRGSDPTAPVPAPLLALSLGALAVLAGAGYLGGALVFTHGVRVAGRPGAADPGSTAEPDVERPSRRSTATGGGHRAITDKE